MNKHYILPLALIFCCMVGCQNREELKEFMEFKAEKEMEQKNKVLAKRYIDAISEGDFDSLKELLSTQYAIYSPSGHPESTSREKLIENYVEVRKSFPKFIWSIEDIIVAKDKVICRIIISGTFKGEIPNLPETEKDFNFSLITIMRIENGQIIEEWQEDDQLGFARQLGMELKPKESEN